MAFGHFHLSLLAGLLASTLLACATLKVKSAAPPTTTTFEPWALTG